MIPTINHWIGQDDAIRRFKIALEASWNDGTKLPHMLFVGSPGTGKTLLANLAARKWASSFMNASLKSSTRWEP